MIIEKLKSGDPIFEAFSRGEKDIREKVYRGSVLYGFAIVGVDKNIIPDFLFQAGEEFNLKIYENRKELRRLTSELSKNLRHLFKNQEVFNYLIKTLKEKNQEIFNDLIKEGKEINPQLMIDYIKNKIADILKEEDKKTNGEKGNDANDKPGKIREETREKLEKIKNKIETNIGIVNYLLNIIKQKADPETLKAAENNLNNIKEKLYELSKYTKLQAEILFIIEEIYLKTKIDNPSLLPDCDNKPEDYKYCKDDLDRIKEELEKILKKQHKKPRSSALTSNKLTLLKGAKSNEGKDIYVRKLVEVKKQDKKQFGLFGIFGFKSEEEGDMDDAFTLNLEVMSRFTSGKLKEKIENIKKLNEGYLLPDSSIRDYYAYPEILKDISRYFIEHALPYKVRTIEGKDNVKYRLLSIANVKKKLTNKEIRARGEKRLEETKKEKYKDEVKNIYNTFYKEIALAKKEFLEKEFEEKVFSSKSQKDKDKQEIRDWYTVPKDGLVFKIRGVRFTLDADIDGVLVITDRLSLSDAKKKVQDIIESGTKYDKEGNKLFIDKMKEYAKNLRFENFINFSDILIFYDKYEKGKYTSDFKLTEKDIENGKDYFNFVKNHSIIYLFDMYFAAKTIYRLSNNKLTFFLLNIEENESYFFFDFFRDLLYELMPNSFQTFKIKKEIKNENTKRAVLKNTLLSSFKANKMASFTLTDKAKGKIFREQERIKGLVLIDKTSPEIGIIGDSPSFKRHSIFDIYEYSIKIDNSIKSQNPEENSFKHSIRCIGKIIKLANQETKLILFREDEKMPRFGNLDFILSISETLEPEEVLNALHKAYENKKIEEIERKFSYSKRLKDIPLIRKKNKNADNKNADNKYVDSYLMYKDDMNKETILRIAKSVFGEEDVKKLKAILTVHDPASSKDEDNKPNGNNKNDFDNRKEIVNIDYLTSHGDLFVINARETIDDIVEHIIFGMLIYQSDSYNRFTAKIKTTHKRRGKNFTLKRLGYDFKVPAFVLISEFAYMNALLEENKK